MKYSQAKKEIKKAIANGQRIFQVTTDCNCTSKYLVVADSQESAEERFGDEHFVDKEIGFNNEEVIDTEELNETEALEALEELSS